MSTKRPPLRPAEPELHPALAVLLILAVCLALWAFCAVVFTVTLVVGGSVGLGLLLVALAGIAWGLR